MLERVLLDLASYTGKDSPVVVQGKVAVPLLVSPEWLASPLTVKDVLYRHDPKLWTSLTEDDERALAEAATDLASRATREAGRIRFSSSDPRVRLAEPAPTPPGPDPFGRSRRIRLWPPGLCADRRLAVVRLSIPWSIHEAVGSYVIARRDGSWTILVRQFVYYP